MKKASPTAIKALRILRDNDVRYASGFGRLLWGKDHPGWSRHTKCGHGTTHGGGMNLASGGYLGKLHRAGWITYGGQGRRYYLTDAGLQILREHKEETNE